MPKSIFQHPEIKRLLKKFNLNENEFKNDFDLLEQVRDDFDNKSKKWIRSFIVDEDNKIKPTLRMSDNFLIKEKLRKNNLTATFFIKNFESEVDFEHPIKDAFERFLKNPEKFKRGYYLVSEKNETDVNQYLLYLAKNAMLADYKIAYISMVELLAFLKRTFTDNERFYALEKKLKQADILFLVDFGLESPSTWFRDEFVLPILDFRLENNLKTFFASSITIKNIMKWKVIKSENPFLEKNRLKNLTSKIEKLAKEIPFD